MPTYEYECPSRHVVERLGSIRDKQPATVRCKCGKRARRIVSRMAGVIADIPSHYNESFGEVVRSRRHLRELQATHDCHDYEPQGEAKARLEHGMAKVKRDSGY